MKPRNLQIEAELYAICIGHQTTGGKYASSRDEGAEMKMLRWSVGLTLKDRMRNEQVRASVAVGELTEKLREIRLHWLGHLVRREESYVGKRVEGIVVGQRRRRRPKRRWRDCIRNDMEVMGLRDEETRNRKMWRRAIRTGDPT